MKTLKVLSGWLSTVCLVAAVLLVIKALADGAGTDCFAGASALGAAVLSFALGAWNPPAVSN